MQFWKRRKNSGSGLHQEICPLHADCLLKSYTSSQPGLYRLRFVLRSTPGTAQQTRSYNPSALIRNGRSRPSVVRFLFLLNPGRTPRPSRVVAISGPRPGLYPNITALPSIERSSSSKGSGLRAWGLYFAALANAQREAAAAAVYVSGRTSTGVRQRGRVPPISAAT